MSRSSTPDGREVATTRVFTGARIVALVVIALLVSGLAYLRFGAGDEPVSVPEGAEVGDLVLEPCTFATEDGAYEADCGTLVVPENRADPQSRLIALPVTRIRALTDQPAEPVFYLEGGPGITNTRFDQASRYVEDRDVVLVGFRGVDGSVRLECPEVATALVHSTDFLSDEFYRESGEAYRACADRHTDEGVDLAGYGLPQEADDLEDARLALGYDRVHLLSQSAGTRRAMIYAWRHPDSVHRSVMIGANPPGHFLWDPDTMDEQLDRYTALCAEDPSCSERTDDLAATMSMSSAQMPDRWLFLPINESNVRVLAFYGMMESSLDVSQQPAPLTFDAWLSAAEGDASGLWYQSFFGEIFPIPMVWGQYAATASIDARAVRDYFASVEEHEENLGYVGTAFAWGGGQLAESWPAVPEGKAYDRVRTSDVETLLIGGELDTSTPPQVATEELLPYLPNGDEVVLPALGHTMSFFAEQPEAGTRLINTFLASGRVDDSLYGPQEVDFTPAQTTTTMAKVLASTMVGLTLFAVLLLVWMARRVQKRGRFGRRLGATLRSLSPIVLGLGGWSLGVLAALTTMPGVPLGGPVLTTLAVGVPTGVGVYLAWVDRGWSAGTRATGLAVAAAGALVGAWLGFHAVEGLLAFLTALVGAAVGTNLALLGLDLVWDRSSRSRFVPVGVTPAPAPAAAGAVLPEPREADDDRGRDRIGGGPSRQW